MPSGGADNEHELKGTARVVAAVFVSVGWTFVSSLLILLNKYLMVDLKFSYPITVSTLGMFGSSILAFLSCRVFNVVKAEVPVTFVFWVTKVLPVGLCMMLTLWAGNVVYLYLSVAFIQILKAFTPVIVMIALFLARLESPSRRIILSVLMITAGTVVSTYGEANFSALGVILMLAAEIFEAVRMVATQYLLVGLKFHPIEGLMYLAPACCVWTMIGAMIAEVPSILSSGDLQIMAKHPGLFALSLVTGFAVNALAYSTIQLASSLTLKVLSTVKNTLLVVIGAVFLGEVVTAVQSLGYVVSLVGFAWYQHIKISQIAVAVPSEPSKATDEEKEPLVAERSSTGDSTPHQRTAASKS